MYGVALVDDHRDDRGLTWLVGRDANDTLIDADHRRSYDRMLARRGKRLVLDE